jgi:lipopolysaccharide heptosyltransferase I
MTGDPVVETRPGFAGVGRAPGGVGGLSGAPHIAIVKLSALGDIVHALPVAAAVRAARPDARVAWLVEARHASILRGHPALAEVIVVDTRGWRRARSPRAVATALRAMRALRRELRAARFDAAIDAQGNLKSGVVTRATGAAVRVGFAAARCRERANALFTNRHVVPGAAARHVVDQYLALLDGLGLPQPARPAFDLPGDAGAEAIVDEMFRSVGLKPRDRVIVLNPGAGRAAKRWPVTRFAELATGIARGGLGRPVVLWGPGERDAAESIARGGVAVLAPATDLGGLIALLRRARVLVAADTGPLHIAAALGVPCVGLYGPTSPERNGPYGAGHRTLRAPDEVMASIPTPAVLDAVTELLA